MGEEGGEEGLSDVLALFWGGWGKWDPEQKVDAIPQHWHLGGCTVKTITTNGRERERKRSLLRICKQEILLYLLVFSSFVFGKILESYFIIHFEFEQFTSSCVFFIKAYIAGPTGAATDRSPPLLHPPFKKKKRDSGGQRPRYELSSIAKSKIRGSISRISGRVPKWNLTVGTVTNYERGSGAKNSPPTLPPQFLPVDVLSNYLFSCHTRERNILNGKKRDQKGKIIRCVGSALTDVQHYPEARNVTVKNCQALPGCCMERSTHNTHTHTHTHRRRERERQCQGLDLNILLSGGLSLSDWNRCCGHRCLTNIPFTQGQANQTLSFKLLILMTLNFNLCGDFLRTLLGRNSINHCLY